METKWGIDKINKPKTPDGRNIIDYYWYWKNEDIIKDLESKRLPFGILVSNLANDFNIGTCLRNCNIFGGKEFFYYGRKKRDRRAEVGVSHYERIVHLSEEKDLDKIPSDYIWVGVDNVPGSTLISEFKWPEKPLMIFGAERLGIPEVLLERCKNVVYIRQQGTAPSANVGTACGIACYDYSTKYFLKDSHD